uniref:NADH-ubiquinone oxidoreductase chain 4 n=1 Tax=Aphrodita australis TaxID=2715517 RepID=A0A6G7IX64_9ANNE|nr:NADH dehydrogenase subunit 4 [Aphrodita australis]QII43121.1 NADH dehydrogenase subunit 4 [Aphrodita australis]
MLALILTLSSLLLLPILSTNFWTLTTIVMFMMTLFSTTLTFNPMTAFSLQSNFLMMDSLSSPLISLSIWISTLMLLASKPVHNMNNNPKLFIYTLTVLLIILTMTFSASNLLSFYIMFEASLIPTLFLILGWGYQPERLQAGMYFMLYTISASLPLLTSIMIMYTKNGQLTFYAPWFQQLHTFSSSTTWWIMTTAAFMVKMPLYSVHLWLPKAHVEAPVAGSMILAGVLLKLGSYGLLRMSMFYPYLSFKMSPIMNSISLLGGVMTSLVCLRQSDMKSLIAYSSIGHMALIIAATTQSSSWGWQAALTMMIAHGLCSSCLFSLANMTYESTKTRKIFLTKGLMSMFPALSLWWFILSAINMSAPPSLNLFSEICLIMSIFWGSSFTMIPLTLMIFLSAAYSLFLYTNNTHGTPCSYSNPFFILNSRNYSICLLHSLPLLLIMKTDILFSWL